MYDFLVWLFKKRTEPFEIAFLNLFHILYFAIIVGLTVGLAFYLKKHSDKKTLRSDTLHTHLLLFTLPISSSSPSHRATSR